MRKCRNRSCRTRPDGSAPILYVSAPVSKTAGGHVVALSLVVGVALALPGPPLSVANLFFGCSYNRRIFQPFAESISTYCASAHWRNPAQRRCLRALGGESTWKVACPQTRPALPSPPTIWKRTLARTNASSARWMWPASPSTGILGRPPRFSGPCIASAFMLISSAHQVGPSSARNQVREHTQADSHHTPRQAHFAGSLH